MAWSVALVAWQCGASQVAQATEMDPDPIVSFQQAELIVEEGQTGVVVHVNLSAAREALIEIAVTGVPGFSEDFTLSSTTLLFSATGPTSVAVRVDALQDGMVEGPERGVLNLLPLNGARTNQYGRLPFAIRDLDGMLVVSANATSGRYQRYEEPGIRILRGLLPDVAAIQEFNVANGARRAFVDETFGSDFAFVVESESTDTIPNGIISRWPITASGEWSDTKVDNRDFLWASIKLPGGRNLHVVSAHFYASGKEADRASQARTIVSRAGTTFPAGDLMVVMGDLNTQDRTESALSVFGAVVSDHHQPADQLGDKDTNQRRSKPLDFVLPNPELDALHLPARIEDIRFPEGAVFDSRLWAAPPYPVQIDDSGVQAMQHMPVIKLFAFATGSVAKISYGAEIVLP